MQPFAPGDRVVAINTDLSGPIMPPLRHPLLPFSFPDGPLRRDRVYYVEAVQVLRDGSQGVFLTHMRVLYGSQNMSWHHSRFRKVREAGHPPVAVNRKEPVKVRIKKAPHVPLVKCHE